MEKHHFMPLRLPLIEFKSKGDLGDKLNRLGENQTIERIFCTIQILGTDGNVVFESEAIIDAGAPFTLLPGSVLNDLGPIQTENIQCGG